MYSMNQANLLDATLWHTHLETLLSSTIKYYDTLYLELAILSKEPKITATMPYQQTLTGILNLQEGSLGSHVRGL